jgi:hypothetical protein
MGTARIARRADFSFRKVAWVELRNDSLAQITSQHTLPRRAGEFYPEDIEPGGFYGMKLFEKLYNHHYKTIHDDEARKRMSLDSVAHRNGIIPPGIWGDERPRWPL